ncbi:hypothetical protein KCV87_08285 [Actinosynnema pretiosum subsp. pretiosum]|uniref:Flagellar assembly protein FliH n=2 Tax=Actinosynnema TaxID=40566 RepID=C6WJR0_ACTMD|nr:FliH/SctL family protein [Actinosynnema mirum]ACU36285.1 flagellar assembly protein FliH [Actinosynnema mirum DSM 43827]QUF06044.1 hypothetical protein KCV87_08285 [Actinosynnema pretiosum subsp. pretiosum]
MTSTSTESPTQVSVLRQGDAVASGVTAFELNVVTAAKSPAEALTALRSEARAEGYAIGWAQGMREARAATAEARAHAEEQLRRLLAHQEAEVRRAIGAVSLAAESLRSRDVVQATEMTGALVSAAVDLAEALVGREIGGEQGGRDALTRALALAPSHVPVRVRLHPHDHALLADENGTEFTEHGRTVVLVADPELTPGAAIAETDETTVDARLETALRRVREELGL